MAILYKPSKHAWIPEGESLTEPEHADSCDINKMIKNAARGMQVRAGAQPVYGHDDLTMDGVQYRILKQQTEEELQRLAESGEVDEEALQYIPDEIKKKFNFKVKKKNAKNDDKTTNNATSTPPATLPATPPAEGEPTAD